MNNEKNIWHVVNIATQVGVNPILWGLPGSGKSNIMEQMGAAQGKNVETIISALYDPSEFTGLVLASVRDGQTVVDRVPPTWASAANQGPTLLFFDELSCAPPSTQAALLRVFAEKVVGNLELNENVSLVAAANPPEIASGGHVLTPALANRFAHLFMPSSDSSSNDNWIEWAISGGELGGNSSFTFPKMEKDWKDFYKNNMMLIASFIKKKPSLMEDMPEESDTASGYAYPTRRSWTMAARMLSGAQALNAPEDIQSLCVSSCVGADASLEFFTYMKALDIPDPEKVLKSKKLPEKVMKRPDLLFATMASLVSFLNTEGNYTKSRWNAAGQILQFLADRGQKDTAFLFARDIIRANKDTKTGLDSMPSVVVTFAKALSSSGYFNK